MDNFTLPLGPIPPLTPLLVLGDIPVLALLLLLQVRQLRLAQRATSVQTRALHEWKVRAYQRLILGSTLITVIPYALWFASLYLLPWSLSYTTPLPYFVGVGIWLPFLVWAAPAAAILIELAETG